MNDEKIVLVQQLKDKSYIAVLNDEYRFDGSVLVEASNEEELNAKIEKWDTDNLEGKIKPAKQAFDEMRKDFNLWNSM